MHLSRNDRPAELQAVLILADHPMMIRYGFVQLLSSRAGMCVVGEMDNCSAAREWLDNTNPDLLQIDMEQREGCTQTIVRNIIEENRSPGVLMYSARAHAGQQTRAACQAYPRLTLREITRALFISE